MADPKIKAVLFDLGGTLFDYNSISSYQLLKSAARRSYEFLRQTGQPVGRFRIYFWRNFLSMRLRHIFAVLAGRDFNSLKLFKRVGARRGIRLSDRQWEHFAWLWYEPLKEAAQLEPDIRQTLETLRGRGLKLGVVSNTFVSGASLDRHLAEAGLLDLLPVRVYSCDFRFRKPNPRIFRIATQRLGCTPAETVYVGDRLRTDVRGAIRAGMHAVLKTNSSTHNKKLPPGAQSVSQISRLPETLEKMNCI